MLGDMLKVWLTAVFIRKILMPMLIIIGLIVLVVWLT